MHTANRLLNVVNMQGIPCRINRLIRSKIKAVHTCASGLSSLRAWLLTQNLFRSVKYWCVYYISKWNVVVNHTVLYNRFHLVYYYEMRTHEDMIEIMKHLQRYDPAIHQRAEQHIPSINVTEVIQEDTFHTILFGGDQLTVANARGCQRIRMNSHS